MQSRLQRALTQRMFVFKREQKGQYQVEFQGKRRRRIKVAQ